MVLLFMMYLLFMIQLIAIQEGPALYATEDSSGIGTLLE